MRVFRQLRSSRSSFLLLLLVLIVALALIGQTWWATVQDRRLTIEAERENGLQAVRLLEQHTRRILDAAVVRLESVAIATSYSDLPVNAIEPAIKGFVEDAVRNRRFEGAFQYLNPRGQAWVSSFDFPPYVSAYEERPFLNDLLRRPDNHHLQIAPPFARMFDDRLILPMARNLYNHAKRHVGAISTDVEVSEFKSVLQPMAQDGSSEVQLLANAGFFIARIGPGTTAPVGLLANDAWPEALRSGSSEGFYHETSAAGDVWQYVFRRSPTYPVTIVLGRDLATTLAPWRDRTRDRILTALVVAALVSIFIYRLVLQIKRQEEFDASLRASESKFNRMFRRSPVPLALIRLDSGAWIEFNEAFSSQFGLPHYAALDATATSIWGTETKREAALQQLRLHDRADHIELSLRHQDGGWLTCMASTRRFPEEGAEVALFSPIDITRERGIENEIRELNTQLEQRVRERTLKLEQQHGELELAIRHAEQAGQAKAHVLAAASHDLRQPLHALSLYSAVLAGQPDAATLGVVAAHIDASVRALNALLNSLLDLSKLDAGVFEIEACPFDLLAMLTRIVNDYREPAQEKFLQLQLEVAPLTVLADPVIVERIARNLIDNAIKYTDFGWIRIQGRVTGGRVEVRVEDSGRGIAHADQTRVFDEFYQVDNPGRDRAQGLGLGLSIVARLAALIGADLRMASTLGEGSVFSWSLPHCEPLARPVARALSPAPAHLRILLVDDELSILHSMRILLQSWGCVVFCASHQTQAEEILRAETEQVDLLIVDLRLQGGADGIVLANHLRAGWGDFPVLLISGETDPNQLRHVARSGLTLLHKPLSPEVLRHNIFASCGSGQASAHEPSPSTTK